MKLTPRFLALGALLMVTAFSPRWSLAQETVAADSSVAPMAMSARLNPGDQAPDFTVVGPKDEKIQLSDYRGKILILDVSATWCGPCQAAMPNNDRVLRTYQDQGVALLGVTSSDTQANYDGWMSRNASKYTFTMAFDPADRAGWQDSVFNTGYHVTGFPTMFVIGRDGKLLETVTGGGPGNDYRLEYALARAGVKVDLANIPPEPKREHGSVPMMGKTAATKTTAMIGMGAPTPAGAKPGFGSIAHGAPVPDFTVEDAQGRLVKLSDLKGKTVIVSFFSNYESGPIPYQIETAKKYSAQNVVLLAVGSAMEKEKFLAWHAAAKPTYSATWDQAGKAWGESVTNLNFGVGMYPALAVVDVSGNLAGGFIGMGAKNVDLLHSYLASAGVKLAKEDAATAMVPAAMVKAAPGGGGMTAAKRIPTLSSGDVAPDFATFDLSGKEVKLSDYKGKVVILDFWATWCGPCMASMPHTQELAKLYADQGVVVLASNTSDRREKFEEWVKKNQSKYPHMIFAADPNDRDSPTFDDRASSKLYHVVGIPTQFIIGRDGKIVNTLVGYDTGDERASASLARAGIKVDPALAAEGEKQLKRDAEQAIKDAAAAKVAEANPKPPFRESFAKIKGGEVVPDFTVQTPEGKTAQFADYAKGKIVIFDFWAPWCGPCQLAMPHLNDLHNRYKDQDVIVLGLCCFDTRENYDQWLKANAGKYNFPTVFDPVGRPKLASKDELLEMSEEDRETAKAFAKDYYDRLIPASVFGAFPMLPTTLVIDRERKLVGSYSGFTGDNEAIGNLLLRAGVKLAPEDMPKRVYTAAETKEAPPEAKKEILKVGAIAPDFVTTDLDGKEVKLSDYKGKVVVLDFWATWCGPCIASMPHTQEVAATYKNQGVVVLGSCTSDTREKFESWVRANQEKYPDFVFSHDAAERKPERASRNLYGVSGIPTQFVIGRDGKISSIVVGYMTGEALLEGALAEAGIKVDAAIVEKARADQAKRDALSTTTKPSTALKLVPKK